MQYNLGGRYIPKRYFVVFLMSVGFTIAQFLRANLSIAIIGMTSSRTMTTGNETLLMDAEFGWNSVEKGLVLGAFSWGHLFAGVASIFVGKIRGTTVFGLGRAISAVLNILSPLFLQTNIYVFFATRILEGLSEGFASAFCMDILIRWVVPEERTFLTTIALFGIPIGNVISHPVSGYVAHILGWRAVFYFSGGIALLWYSIWFSFVGNDFLEDRFISDAEKSFLKNKIEIISKKNNAVPWKSILTSVPVYAFFNEFFCCSWFYSFISVSLPMYVKDVLEEDIKDIGLLSAIPPLCGLVMLPLFAYLADYLRSNDIFSISKVHKIFISCGQLFGLVFLLIATYSYSYLIAIVCFSCVQIVFGMSVASYLTLPMDLAGQYSTVIEAIALSFTSIGYFLSPLVQAFMVPNHTQDEWNHYFLFLSAISTYGLFMFLRFGSGETQKWAILRKLEANEVNERNQEMKLSEGGTISSSWNPS